MQVYLNGHFVSLGEAKVSVMERAFLFGDGVYEVIPVYNNNVFYFDEHFERLQNSLSGVKIQNPKSKKQLIRIIQRLLRGNDKPTIAIYLQISRGVDKNRNHIYSSCIKPNIFIQLFDFYNKKIANIKGIDAITAEDNRGTICNLKTINLLSNIIQKQLAHNQSADEVILIRRGFAQEGGASNLFMVKDDVIYTPPLSNTILPGVTRKIILGIAKEKFIKLKEHPIRFDELFVADELWVTSSTKEIRYIKRLNKRKIGKDGQPIIWHKIVTEFNKLKK
jgi:D-alanine transaminase